MFNIFIQHHLFDKLKNILVNSNHKIVLLFFSILVFLNQNHIYYTVSFSIEIVLIQILNLYMLKTL